jgi:hypothetical protein
MSDKDLEQNALASRLSRAWTNFKQGKLISYKVMAIILLAAAGLGLWWYVSSERSKGTSKMWVDFDEAFSIGKLEEIAKQGDKNPTARLAELLIARGQLGPEGIEQLSSIQPEVRQKAVESIEKAREAFGKLLDQFKDDPVFKAECLLGLAKAEAALVAVPVKQEQPTGTGPIALTTEFRGKVPKVVEYLDKLTEAAAPNTPWATDSKKLADALRNETSPGSAEFVRVQRSLFEFHSPFTPTPKGGTPGGPIAPGGPGTPGGGPIAPGPKQ